MFHTLSYPFNKSLTELGQQDCTTGTLPCELSPRRLKVGLDRTEVTESNFIVFKNSLHALGFSIY